MQDKEVALRLLFPTFNIINQEDCEIKYLSETRASAEKNEDSKSQEGPIIQKTYQEMDCKQLIVYVNKVLNQTSDTNQCVIAFRTTGGYHSDWYGISNMFDSGTCYCSASIKKAWDNIVSVSGIVCENGDNNMMTNQLIQEFLQTREKFGYPQLDNNFQNMINQGQARYYRVLLNSEAFNKSIRSDKSEITEYDINLHKYHFAKNLFLLKSLTVNEGSSLYACLANLIAVFAHDYPINLESHPLPRMVRHLYEENKILKSDGLVPKVQAAQENYIELNQSLYLDYFNDFSKTNMSFEKAMEIVKAKYKSKRIIELFEGLGSLKEFFKLRLVCILKLDAASPATTIELQQNIACRYITVSGLDKENSFNGDNMEFRAMKFHGKAIKAPFTLAL